MSYGQKYGVTFKMTGFPKEVYSRVDARRLSQVITNFLSNASKFTHRGDTILVYGKVTGSYIRVCVEDHGQGIAPEFHEKIFQKFSQADSTLTRKQEGTGLGLHICKEMIQNMGGRIGFESDGKNGSVFWFELPINYLH